MVRHMAIREYGAALARHIRHMLAGAGSNRLGLIFLGCAILVVGLLGYLVWDSASDKGSASPLKAALFIIGVLFALASIVVGWEAEGDGRLSFRRMVAPKAAGAILLSLFGAFSVMTDVLALFEPRTAVESSVGAIENGVEQIAQVSDRIDDTTQRTGRDTELIKSGLQQAGLIGASSLIRQKLPGIWGEAGCKVTYRFAVASNAVALESARNEPGMKHYKATATIISEHGSRLVTSSTTPEQGVTVELTYRFDGIQERLIHHDKRSNVMQEFVRCT